MWPRICEALVSLWMLIAPEVFPGDIETEVLTRVAAIAMLTLSLLSLLERLRRAYLGTLVVSLVIAAYPLTQPHPASPLAQNLMIAGLVIAMFAILPPDAMKPPRSWREFESRTR